MNRVSLADAGPRAIVVGNGVPGAEAALELARAGAAVTLVTADNWLSTGDAGVTAIPTLIEATRHPRIDLATGATVESLDQSRDGLRLVATQAPRWVDPDRCTSCGACTAVCPVELPSTNGRAPHRAIYSGGVPTVYSIDKAGTAPCRDACPIDQRAQGYTALVRERRYAEAYRTIKLDNPFPSVCGRVCNHRCEDACSRAKFDAPVSVMAIKRFVTDWAMDHPEELERAPAAKPTSTGKRIAVVGSGPSGLTCALDLVRQGHQVTVFEELPVAGGMMRVGVPEYRLPQELVQHEIDDIVAEGVEIVLERRVEDIPGLLAEGFDAVYAATGAHEGIGLPIPGAEGEDVLLATDFLRGAALERAGLDETLTHGNSNLVSGRRVVVLGGGNVAVDTAMTALRYEAESVAMTCLESRETMPSHDWEVRDAEEEGIEVYPSRTFKEIVRDDEGRVEGVRCAEIDFHGFEDGRPVFDELEGADEVIPGEVVIFAIGQKPKIESLGEEVDKVHGRFARVDPQTMSTSVPGLFAGGDLVTGTSFVVDAIAAGRRAAEAIDRYVMGSSTDSLPPLLETVELERKEVESRVGLDTVSSVGRVEPRKRPPTERRHDFREVYATMTEDEAVAEARRCLSCGFCSECLQCVEACPAGAIDHQKGPATLDIETEAVLWTDDRVPAVVMEAPGGNLPGVYHGTGDGALTAAVDQALSRLGLVREIAPESVVAPARRVATAAGGGAAGVFLCRCGGEIERTVDLGAVAERMRALAGVDHVEVIDFACHPEGREAVDRAWTRHGLDRAVLAACSCCALDQVCYSCTTQRTRCKERLGVFQPTNGRRMDFVNIREQCAFVHSERPQAATAKAGDMVAACVAAQALRPNAPATDGSQRDQGPVQLARTDGWAKVVDERVPTTALVDPVRCRGCEDCELACGFEAIKVIGTNGTRIAEVDPAACLGCGICMAACSSGAIAASDSSDAQVAARLEAMGDLTDTTVVFTCNWGAYSALEAAGSDRLQYDAGVRVLRLQCAGRTHPGLILRAFGQGASRVAVFTCGHDGDESLCRYKTGGEQARRTVETAKGMLHVLGIDSRRLAIAEMSPGDGERFVAALAEMKQASATDRIGIRS